MTLEERRECNKKWYFESIGSNEENNAKLFTKIAPKMCGRFVKVYPNKFGFCVGITLGDDDFYWLIIDEDRKVIYDSGVANPDYYDNDEIPSSLYILNYLLDNQPKEILKLIKKSLNKNSDYLFTKIYLKHGKTYDLSDCGFYN